MTSQWAPNHSMVSNPASFSQKFLTCKLIKKAILTHIIPSLTNTVNVSLLVLSLLVIWRSVFPITYIFWWCKRWITCCSAFLNRGKHRKQGKIWKMNQIRTITHNLLHLHVLEVCAFSVFATVFLAQLHPTAVSPHLH